MSQMKNRAQLAQELFDMKWDYNKEDQRKVATVIGHLSPPEAKAVIELWRAMIKDRVEAKRAYHKGTA
jgi:hypothetical protein